VDHKGISLALTVEIPRIFKTQFPQCPDCHAETSDDDRFCQDCGSALATLTAGVSNSQSMGRLHPSLGKPVIALPLVALGIVGFILVVLFLVSFEKSYGSFSNKYVTDQANKAYKENRLDEAAVVLERLALNHNLDDEQQALLGAVYLSRAEQRAGRSDYVSALADLNKISPHYAKFVLVCGKKNEYVELLKVQQAQALAAAAHAKSRSKILDRAKLRIAAKTNLSATPNPIGVPPSVMLGLTSSITGSAPTLPSIAGMAPSVVRSSVVLVTPSSVGVAPTKASQDPHKGANSEVPNGVSSAADPSPSSTPGTGNKGAKPKPAKILEHDVVRYNELLARYFSQDKKQLSGSAEPPALKEWIELGKPSF
jgi:hypothetical protein